MTEPIYLGIDPAIALIGFGIIQGNQALEYGVIQTKAGVLLCDRLAAIERDIIELCSHFQIAAVGLEQPFYRGGKTTSSMVPKAIGVIELALGKAGLKSPVYLNAAQVKKAVTGSGKAEKREMKVAVQQLFNLATLPKPDDVADGLAIAYATQQGVTSAITGGRA